MYNIFIIHIVTTGTATINGLCTQTLNIN